MQPSYPILCVALAEVRVALEEGRDVTGVDVSLHEPNVASGLFRN